MSQYNSPQYGKKEIKPAKKPEEVLNYGLWLLGRRDRTLHELRQKLARKTENQDWIDTSLKKLQDLGYLNERRFVEQFIQNCNEFKQYGPSRIRQELRLKGADNDTVNNVFSDSEFDYFESALNTLNKKCRQPVEDKKERDRLTRFLLSRGFSFDMIRYAFEEHLKEDN